MIVGRTGLSGEEVQARWRASRPFALTGFACVVAGGLVAAVSGPLGLEMGSWAAAYLVLVAGVAQLGLGVGQAWIPLELPTRRVRVWEFATWNGGNGVVLAATFASLPFLVAAGGILLLVALVLFQSALRGPLIVATHWLATYRVVAILLTVGVLSGVVLSLIRHS